MTFLALKLIPSKIFGGADASIESTLSSLDAVNAAAFSKVRIFFFLHWVKALLIIFFFLPSGCCFPPQHQADIRDNRRVHPSLR